MVGLPAACDEVRGSEPGTTFSGQDERVAAEQREGRVDALTAIIGALGHVQTGR